MGLRIAAEAMAAWDLAEQAWVRLRDRSTVESEGWIELAEHYLRRDDIDQAFTTLKEAFTRTERPAARLWILWAEAMLSDPELHEVVTAAGLVASIQVLEQPKATFDDEEWSRWAVDKKLRDLYTLLGELENPDDSH